MVKLNAKSVLKRVVEFVWVTVAGILNGFSLYSFINPSHLIAGGFSGLSSALTYVFNLFITSVSYEQLMSVVYFVLNIPLLICSVIFLRGDFTVKTIWATLVCTGTLAVLPAFPQLQFTESRLIAVIFGGILIGASMYIASQNNGSNGGTEIIARIVSKYHPEIDLSKVIFCANFAITLTGSAIVIAIVGETLAIVIYSIVYIVIGSSVMGMLKRGFNHPQKYLIVTRYGDKMSQAITDRFKRGCSHLGVAPAPEHPDRQIVMVVVQYRQTHELKKLIKSVDSEAFTFVKDVYDVFSRPTFNRSYKTK